MRDWVPYLAPPEADIRSPFIAVETIHGQQWSLRFKPLYASRTPVTPANLQQLLQQGFSQVSALSVVQDSSARFKLN